jgi:hypothetical protein
LAGGCAPTSAPGALRFADDNNLLSQEAESVSAWQAELNVRAFQLNSDGAADETEGDVTSCQIWMLPATVRLSFRCFLDECICSQSWFSPRSTK